MSRVLCFLMAVVALGGGDPTFDFPISVDRPDFVAEGEEDVEFTCRLGAGLALESDTCVFLDPAGKLHLGNVESGVVLGEDSDGLEAFGGDDFCGLRFRRPLEGRDLGQWGCNVNRVSGGGGRAEVFHRVDFNLFDERGAGYAREGVRLPYHVVPVAYDLTFNDNIDELTLEGEMTLTFNFFESLLSAPGDTTKIYLNAKNILIDEASVRVEVNGEQAVVAGHEYDLDRERYVLHLEEDMPEDVDISLFLPFQSVLTDGGLVGAYALDETSAATQFAFVDARRAFPCLDEPDRKAVFRIKVARSQADEGTLSNAEAVDVEIISFPERTFYSVFDESPPLPPYLVAFIVSQLSSREYEEAADTTTTASTSTTTTEDNGMFLQTGDTDTTPTTDGSITTMGPFELPVIRAWTTEDKLEQTSLALEAAASSLQFYQDLLRIPYPLSKVDLVAVPDMYYGGMENLGMDTFKERVFLFKEGEGSSAAYKSVVGLVAHELAHAWFGDYATMSWFDEVWLNEGLGTYFTSWAAQTFDGELANRQTSFYFEARPALALDALPSSRAVRERVDNPRHDINYDDIVYDKAARVVRMLENALGFDVLLEGIRAYLADSNGGAVSSDDLWAALDDAADDAMVDLPDDVANITNAWFNRPGYPVVSVRGRGLTRLTIGQDLFAADVGGGDDDEDEEEDDDDGEERAGRQGDAEFYIPVTLSTVDGVREGEDKEVAVWLEPGGGDVNLSLGLFSAYVLNVGRTGFYRVNYDDANWEMLIDTLADDPSALPAIDRAGTIDDAFALAETGVIPYDVALRFATDYLPNEFDFLPLATGLEGLQRLKGLMERAGEIEGSERVNEIIVAAVQRQYDRWGFEEPPRYRKSWLEKQARATVLGAMCSSGYRDCLERAGNLFAAWIDDDEAVEPELRDIVYSTALARGGRTEWNYLRGQLDLTDDAQERYRILYALSGSTSDFRTTKLLDETIDGNSGLRREDAFVVYSAVGASKPRLQFDWLESKYDDVKRYFGADFLPSYAPSLLGGLVRAGSQGDLNDVLAFLELRRADGLFLGVSELNIDLDRAAVADAWVLSGKAADVSAWIEENFVVTTTSSTTAGTGETEGTGGTGGTAGTGDTAGTGGTGGSDTTPTICMPFTETTTTRGGDSEETTRGNGDERTTDGFTGTDGTETTGSTVSGGTATSGDTTTGGTATSGTATSDSATTGDGGNEGTGGTEGTEGTGSTTTGTGGMRTSADLCPTTTEPTTGDDSTTGDDPTTGGDPPGEDDSGADTVSLSATVALLAFSIASLF